jgi:hypothetical protein
MKTRLASLLVLLGFILPGCTLLDYQDPQLGNKIDTLLQQNEYQVALNKLSHVNTDHPDYRGLMKKKQQVLRAAEKFENEIYNKAQQQISNDLWHDANQTYQYGIEKYGESKKLNSAYRDFLSERQSYQDELRFQLLINQAESLIKNKNIEHELYRVTPDNRDVKQELDHHEKAARQAHTRLLICGEVSEKNRDYITAEKCYTLANQIKKEDSTSKKIAQVQNKIEVKQRNEKYRLTEKGQVLLSKAKQALESNNLKQALNLYKRIPAKDKNSKRAIKFKAALDKQVNQSVTQGIEVGRKLYSQGEIEQAIAVWNDLLELDPGNKNLSGHINRAQRVLEKLKQIEKDDEVVIPPGAKGNS